MQTIQLQAKKWGDSIAVIIPKEIVRKEHITAKDILHVTIQKGNSIRELFGCWTANKNKTVQQLKDESKKGWD